MNIYLAIDGFDDNFYKELTILTTFVDFDVGRQIFTRSIDDFDDCRQTILKHANDEFDDTCIF